MVVGGDKSGRWGWVDDESIVRHSTVSGRYGTRGRPRSGRAGETEGSRYTASQRTGKKARETPSAKRRWYVYPKFQIQERDSRVARQRPEAQERRRRRGRGAGRGDGESRAATTSEIRDANLEGAPRGPRSPSEELDQRAHDRVRVRDRDVVRAALDRDEFRVRDEGLHARRVAVWHDAVGGALRGARGAFACLVRVRARGEGMGTHPDNEHLAACFARVPA